MRRVIEVKSTLGADGLGSTLGFGQTPGIAAAHQHVHGRGRERRRATWASVPAPQEVAGSGSTARLESGYVLAHGTTEGIRLKQEAAYAKAQRDAEKERRKLEQARLKEERARNKKER